LASVVLAVARIRMSGKSSKINNSPIPSVRGKPSMSKIEPRAAVQAGI